MLPVIDIDPLITRQTVDPIARQLDRACRTAGFFLIRNHGVSTQLVRDLLTAAHTFFALPVHEKAEVAMPRFGRTWRGWFPLGGERTSGVPDQKEGYYFGRNLLADDPRVLAGLPLHGPNPYPGRVPALADLVERYLVAMKKLASTLMRGLACGLGLPGDFFDEGITRDPTELFRMFHYPNQPRADGHWGVAEHTDYGLLTIVFQDGHGGLEVHTPDGWIEATPIPNTFVCNLGDMLERLTGGRYRSTPHRVRVPRGDAATGRISFAYFYDPSWQADSDSLRPLQNLRGEPTTPHRARWDHSDPMDHRGTYGEYLTAKVANVFPNLFEDTIA